MVDASTGLFGKWDWRPPETWLRIGTIDTHTGGEPLRIVTSGLPRLEGRNVLEKRRYFMQHLDHVRSGILREPRGHADMYGAILTPAADDADLDIFFINTVGYSPMCGHGIIAITKVILETNLLGVRSSNELIFNVPPGRNYARGSKVDGVVDHVSFHNVPSFVALRNAQAAVPELGHVTFDLAFGGAYYAIVEAPPLGLDLTPAHYDRLIDYGRRIKRSVVEQFVVEHPFEPDMSTLFGVIFTGPAHDPAHHSRNVTVYEDGEVDRSATGTGVSARAALLHATGSLEIGQRITIESILGSTMTVRATETLKFGSYEAIVPEVGGSAHIMGRSEFFFDPKDPLATGFILR